MNRIIDKELYENMLKLCCDYINIVDVESYSLHSASEKSRSEHEIDRVKNLKLKLDRSDEIIDRQAESKDLFCLPEELQFLQEINNGIKKCISIHLYTENANNHFDLYVKINDEIEKVMNRIILQEEKMDRPIIDKKQISMDVDFFEHLLNCLANQKFVNELPSCGDALAVDVDDYNKIQKDAQITIDRAYIEGHNILGEFVDLDRDNSMDERE